MSDSAAAVLKVGLVVGSLALAFYVLRRFAVVIVPGLMLFEALRHLDERNRAAVS